MGLNTLPNKSTRVLRTRVAAPEIRSLSISSDAASVESPSGNGNFGNAEDNPGEIPHELCQKYEGEVLIRELMRRTDPLSQSIGKCTCQYKLAQPLYCCILMLVCVNVSPTLRMCIRF